MSCTARHCPLCGWADAEYLLELPARSFCRANSTYRTNFATILGIEAETAYPIVRCRNCTFVYASLLPSKRFLDLVYDEVIDPERGF